AIAGEGRHAKNPPHVGRTIAFASHEFSNAVEKTAVRQILGRCRMNRMEISVKADVVLPERGNDIVPAASFQSARLLADDLESGPDFSLREQVRHAFGRVVRGGKQVVLRVEPQNDINPRRVLRRLQTPGKSGVTQL